MGAVGGTRSALMEEVKNGSTTSFKLREFSAFALVTTIVWGTDAQSQANTFWDGGETGGGTSWQTNTNWLNDARPPNAANSNVIIDNRNGTGTISSMSVSRVVQALACHRTILEPHWEWGGRCR